MDWYAHCSAHNYNLCIDCVERLIKINSDYKYFQKKTDCNLSCLKIEKAKSDIERNKSSIFDERHKNLKLQKQRSFDPIAEKQR